MAQLIEGLLNFSRFSRAALDTQPVRLDDIVRQVLEELRPARAGRMRRRKGIVCRMARKTQSAPFPRGGAP